MARREPYPGFWNAMKERQRQSGPRRVFYTLAIHDGREWQRDFGSYDYRAVREEFDEQRMVRGGTLGLYIMRSGPSDVSIEGALSELKLKGITK